MDGVRKMSGGGVLAVLCGVLFAAHVSAAGEHPDFSGVWELDLDAPGSTSMDALLATQGMSWLERKAADTIEVVQTITQTEHALTIHVEGGGQSKTEVLDLDGKVQVRNTDKAGRVETRSYWSEDGKSIVTVSKYRTPEGKPAVWTTRRSLAGGGKVIVVDHEVKVEGGGTFQAKRFLRKKS